MSAGQARRADSEVVQTLMEYPFFRNFGEDLLRQLADLSAYVTVRKGQNLLTQGQLNSNLYILIQGRLSVIVDGAKVATLERPGDLVGEMSVISKRACSATIRAEMDCEFYRLKADELSQIKGKDEDRIQHLLYRIYSQVLSERLELTNQKAKRIEEMNFRLEEAQQGLREANKDLELRVSLRTKDLEEKTKDLILTNQRLEQKNAEMMASHRKLEELYSNRSVTFSQLQRLYKDHFIPLRASLENLGDLGDSYIQNTIDSVKVEVMMAIRLLEPITRLYSTELAMRSKRVLLADSNKKQQINAKMALGGTGVQLEIVDGPEQAQSLVESTQFDIIFFDSASLPLSEVARKKNPFVKTVLMTSEHIPNYLAELSQLSFMPNIVSRREEDRTFTLKNIITTATKLVSQDIFGIDKYLAWGVNIQSHDVKASYERAELIQGMEKHFLEIGVRGTHRKRCALVAEELLMNAIYDAPVDLQGKSLFNHLPRTERVELNPEQQSHFRYATDGLLIAVSVEDPFGSLTGETILRYLQSCYGGQAGSLNSNKGGAGRGLHQIVENSDLVVFNLHPGHKTEVICLFNVDIHNNPSDHPGFHLFIV